MIHNYRGGWDWLKAKLDTRAGEAARRSPVTTVPTITLEGDANGAPHPDPSAYAAKLSAPCVHRTIRGGIGHNLPQEAPVDFAAAIIDLGRGRP